MTNCRTCRAEIEFIPSEASGRKIPAQRVTQIFVEIQDGRGGKVLRQKDLAHVGGAVYVSHFQTCPDADSHSKKRGS